MGSRRASIWVTGGVAALVSLLPACLPTAAQTFTGTMPTQPFTLPQAPTRASPGPQPGAPAAVAPAAVPQPPSQSQPPAPIAAHGQPTSAAPSASPVPTAAAPPASAEAPTTDTVLRHLPNVLGGFRVTGEIGTLEWPVYLTAAEATAHVRFRVGYLTAVSDAPEASFLTLTINDVKIGETRLEAPNGVKIVEFDVPGQVLKAGFNGVRIWVAQRHRVDCSVAATYELWTQLDPAQTGFVIPQANAFVADIRDLAAVSPDASGAYPIRVVLARRPTVEQMRRDFRAVQALALAGHFEQPIVEFGPPSKGRDGVELVIATLEDLPKVHVEPPAAATGEPSIVVQPAEGERPVTVILTGGSDEGVDRAVASLLERAKSEVQGSPSGLRAILAASGARVEGGERIRLGDLGVVSQEFSGRLFRSTFNIVMPPDFLPADYAKATLDLAGGYAAGLSPGAQVLVRINGKSVASDRLPKSSGEVFKQKQIFLPLGYWQAGINRIEVLAELPTAFDAACEFRESGPGPKRFLFLDDTVLAMPKFARVGHMPELAATAGGGLPFTSSTRSAKLFIPVPNRATVSAAATFVARLAVSSGQPIDFVFTTRSPAPGSGPTLVVAAARTLDKGLLPALGVDPAALQRAWEERAKSADVPLADGASDDLTQRLQDDAPLTCRVPHWTRPPVKAVAPEVASSAISTPVKTAQGGLYDRWSDDLNARADWVGWTIGGVSRAVDWTFGMARASAQWTAGRFAPAAQAEPVEPEHSLLVVQSSLGGSLDDVVTLVTAPNASLLQSSMSCLTEPRVWTKLGGRLAALDGSDGSVRTRAADNVAYVRTAPFSIENMRLIAAGWLSNNPAFYVILILVIALCLGVTTTGVVRNIGRRQP